MYYILQNIISTASCFFENAHLHSGPPHGAALDLQLQLLSIPGAALVAGHLWAMFAPTRNRGNPLGGSSRTILTFVGSNGLDVCTCWILEIRKSLQVNLFPPGFEWLSHAFTNTPEKLLHMIHFSWVQQLNCGLEGPQSTGHCYSLCTGDLVAGPLRGSADLTDGASRVSCSVLDMFARAHRSRFSEKKQLKSTLADEGCCGSLL